MRIAYTSSQETAAEFSCTWSCRPNKNFNCTLLHSIFSLFLGRQRTWGETRRNWEARTTSRCSTSFEIIKKCLKIRENSLGICHVCCDLSNLPKMIINWFSHKLFFYFSDKKIILASKSTIFEWRSHESRERARWKFRKVTQWFENSILLAKLYFLNSQRLFN